ncbi:UDP-N-acetylmuramoyl-L-alanyl-D-glutamate--2,6-diaminopimelate ligase [Desulfolucanica intricata]|uniref:UDP-N-acetylmuramoyl-L-alanyl-D-glutamate--2, 6-diaminopimelate ligase n=1 Tax=Desulfolucanica intricata TaxID=1285191 RepID=UPI000A43C398|nr:UDP-N-acetylmuramoyl-L-alanyl-D-glutamate--2,6-diaminopimelate ligase [Desulfolucanica intricata]
MLLKELVQVVDVLAAGGNQEVPVHGIAYDSRQAKPGFLFVAVEGLQTDGHNFIEQAVAKGISAVVIEKDIQLSGNIPWVRVKDSRKALALLSTKFYGQPSRQMTLVGVTGTNGKTTTTHLIEAIFRAEGKKTGLIGTNYNRIGDKILPVKNTTPESADLQALLRQMADAGVDAVCMEVSSHALSLSRVAGCEFDIAVFTNLTQDHLDFHKNMEDYLAAKSTLFTGLKDTNIKKRPRFAIINLDDVASKVLLEKSGGEVITYGIKQDALVRAEDIKVEARGVSFTVVSKQGRIQLKLNLTGTFNVYNALAAYAAGMVLGMAPEKIKAALEGVQGVAGRFELVDMGQNFAVIVDYAHTPDGLENILTTAREFVTGKLITVFGCGGDRDRTKRPLMGEIAARLSDFSVVTSDNPRTEDPERILLDILVGVSRVVDKDRYTVISDRREAIKYAIKTALPGDVIIIAGKGHENYQILGTKRYPFDDREEARLVLKELGYQILEG